MVVCTLAAGKALTEWPLGNHVPLPEGRVTLTGGLLAALVLSA